MKLPKIGVHPAFLAVMLVGFFTETIFRILAVYLCLLIHEAGHIAVAGGFGQRLSYIKIMPFGIAMRFSATIKSRKIQGLIAAAGPFFSIIAGLLSENLFFRTANLALGIFNLLPAKTLDGGTIFFAVLSSKWGTIRAYKALKFTSYFISGVMLIFGGYLLFISRFNVSLVLVSVFLIYNLVSGGAYGKISAHVTALDYKAKKLDGGIGRTAYLTASADAPLRRILTHLPSGKMCFINITDHNHRLIDTISEQTAVEIMLKHGAYASYNSIKGEKT